MPPWFYFVILGSLSMSMFIVEIFQRRYTITTYYQIGKISNKCIIKLVKCRSSRAGNKVRVANVCPFKNTGEGRKEECLP